MQMPVIKEAVDKLPEHMKPLAVQLIGRGGRLRSSKPKDANAAYVWRMVAFNVSPKPEHQCMPVSVYFFVQVPGESKWSVETVDRFIKETLDPIIDAVIDNIPATEWHGVRRWTSALGGF